MNEISPLFTSNINNFPDKNELSDTILSRNYNGQTKYAIIQSETLEKYGFTQDTFRNFNKFMVNKEDYKKRYKQDFEDHFYGSEAFAFLIENELSTKMKDLNNRKTILNKIEEKRAIEKNSNDPKARKEAYEERNRLINVYVKNEIKIDKLNTIPQDLIPFYNGFLNKELIISNTKIFK